MDSHTTQVSPGDAFRSGRRHEGVVVTVGLHNRFVTREALARDGWKLMAREKVIERIPSNLSIVSVKLFHNQAKNRTES